MSITIVQQILNELNPSLNVKVGSPLYFTMVLPMSKLYEDLLTRIETTKIDSALGLTTDETRVDALLTNFGVQRISGIPARGKLFVELSPSVAIYVFPIGSTFTHEDGTIVQTTEDITATESFEVEVETLEGTTKVYDVGNAFISTLYGSLVLSSTVSAQIAGGIERETNEQLISRIQTELTENTVTSTGVRVKLQNTFKEIIDSKTIQDIIYIKTGVEKITVNSSGVISNPVLFYESLPNGAELSQVDYFNWVISLPENTEFVYYTSKTIKEAEDYLNSNDILPLGITYKVRFGNIVFVSGNIKSIAKKETEDFLSFFLNYKIGNFSMSDFVNSLKNKDIVYPIELTFNGTKVVTEYVDNLATYFVKDVRVI